MGQSLAWSGSWRLRVPPWVMYRFFVPAHTFIIKVTTEILYSFEMQIEESAQGAGRPNVIVCQRKAADNLAPDEFGSPYVANEG